MIDKTYKQDRVLRRKDIAHRLCRYIVAALRAPNILLESENLLQFSVYSVS